MKTNPNPKPFELVPVVDEQGREAHFLNLKPPTGFMIEVPDENAQIGIQEMQRFKLGDRTFVGFAAVIIEETPLIEVVENKIVLLDETGTK